MSHRKQQYHTLFFTIIRPLVILRDEAVCASCGKQDLSNHVHHRDKDKLSTDLSNFMVLCQSCHNRRLKFRPYIMNDEQVQFNIHMQSYVDVLVIRFRTVRCD
jgi:hypothetical protein